ENECEREAEKEGERGSDQRYHQRHDQRGAWTCRAQPSDVAPGRAHTERDERERDDCDRDARDDLDRTGDGCARAHTGAENPASRSADWPGPSRYATKAR